LKFDENNAMNSMLALSNCYISINKYHLAKEYCDKVSLLIDTVTAPSQLVYDWLITKSKIFEKNGKIKESLASINQYQTLKLKNERAQKQFKAEQYFELYQLEIDQQQLKQQELKLAKLANIETKNSRLKWVAGLALIILIGGAILMYVINRLQKKIRKQLIDKKDVAENALALKESMVKEIHHRVKNNLQVVSGLLQLQANITESEEVKETLKEGENRIFSIASIHQLLYEHPEVEEILVQEYIEKLVFQIAQVYTEKHQIKIDVENITINSEVAIPLGLILNELITNTYKHAYDKGVTGTIHIKLRKENEQYLFRYMDDGKGIPTDVDLTKAKSLGLRIVRLMSEQIKGKLKIEKGAKFSLKF
ncbi:MAG: sensor histidine kinase, partial [Flavobacteriales bacterium]|nr:sensor histidine kinase [Flavobacteriales bacterium]